MLGLVTRLSVGFSVNTPIIMDLAPNECEPGWYNRREVCIRLVQDYEGADFMDAQVIAAPTVISTMCRL